MDGQDEINGQDGKGRTPLYLATRRLDFDAIETLLDAGADPRIADRWGRTPIRLAERQGLDLIRARFEDISQSLGLREKTAIASASTPQRRGL